MKTIFVSTLLLGLLSVGAAGCARDARPADPVQLAADARTACAGVPDDARQQLHAQLSDVEAHHVDRIEGQRRVGRATIRVTQGARIFLKAQPGLSVPWLQRVVACETAHVAANGAATPASSIFAVPGATTEIRSAYGGFTMDVKAHGTEASNEVHRRAVAWATTRSLPGDVARNE